MAAALLATLVMAAPRLVNRDAIGIGDVKLVLVAGAALGWSVFGALLLAFVCAFPFALVTVARRGWGARTQTLAFGPFLALGTVLVIFSGSISG